jgi:protein-tyrosine phosphatase
MTCPTPDDYDASQVALPPGRIDIHSHMLPGIDDGCETIDDAIASIHMLTEAGFVGSICTPHIWIDPYPANTIEHIQIWTDDLRQRLAERGVTYRIWPGGELRIFKGAIDFLKANGVPTLADSRYVLVDLWETKWPKWVNKTFSWLLSEEYKPILAHPERMSVDAKPQQRISELAREGVLLQGNFACFTGEEGRLADQWVRQWLAEGRYTFLAMDMHRPPMLPTRIDGMNMVISEFGQQQLDQLTITNPRKLIFNES